MGQRLRKLRERAGLSRAQLSDATGVTSSAILRLEDGADVRLSTYFPIINYFVEFDGQRRMQAELLAALTLGEGEGERD